MVLDRGADDPARIGDEIRNHHHALFRQDILGFQGDPDVGPRNHQLCLEPMEVVDRDDVGSRGRDPYVAIQTDYLADV